MRQPATQDKATMTNQLFESALGITTPWYVQGVDFDAAQRQLTIVAYFGERDHGFRLNVISESGGR
jgi:hypothetical protein